MNDKLIIVGLRGVGKTTCAKKLAQRLGWRVIDTDQLILKRFGKLTIGEVHKRVGEEEFRRIEQEVVLSLDRFGDKIVISAGGGVFLCEKNRNFLEELGMVICLHIDKEALKKRWKKMPPYSPKVDSFDSWYGKRTIELEKMKGLWVDPREDGWIEKIVGVGIV